MLLLVAALLGGATSPAAMARGGLSVGFFDPVFADEDPGVRSHWLERSAELGGQTVRVFATWRLIAPAAPPAGFRADDPADASYDWSQLDAAMRSATAAQLTPFVTISSAPPWAEGPNRPADALTGTWQPDPAALAAFSRAAALRYSGRFPDPLAPGHSLPRVRTWQIWNEPNIYTNLTPQWIRRSGRWVTNAPGRYRRMLDQAYTAVKSAVPGDRIVTAGTGPYGDPQPGGRRLSPVRFWRDLLCLDAALRRRPACPAPARFDVFAHHPYATQGPFRAAGLADDASLPDIHKISAVVAAGVDQGTVKPRTAKPAWVTEFAWDSAPPDPRGVAVATLARWIPQALLVLWRQGVSQVSWLRIVDEAPIPSFAATSQSGMYLPSGAEKSIAPVFAFPFLLDAHGGHTVVWGLAPRDGPVSVQRRDGSAWRTILRIRTSGRVFTHAVPGSTSGLFRARSAGRTSPTWRAG